MIADPYVTSDSGTGVVHCAPAFGEDDYRVCLANGEGGEGVGVVWRVWRAQAMVGATSGWMDVWVGGWSDGVQMAGGV